MCRSVANCLRPTTEAANGRSELRRIRDESRLSSETDLANAKEIALILLSDPPPQLVEALS